MTACTTRLTQLKSIPLFADLPDAELGVLAQASRTQDYARNEVVCVKGDRATALYAVLSGTVRISCMAPDGGEKVVDLLGPGQTFGEGTLFLGDQTQPFLAAAMSPAQLLLVDGAVLRDVVHASPRLSLRMLLRLSEWILAVMRNIEDVSMRTTHERVVHFLLAQQSQSECDGFEPDTQDLVFPAPKHVCASLLGMTPESFSRTVRDLAEDGLIAVKRRRVDVLDWPRLAARAGM